MNKTVLVSFVCMWACAGCATPATVTVNKPGTPDAVYKVDNDGGPVVIYFDPVTGASSISQVQPQPAYGQPPTYSGQPPTPPPQLPTIPQLPQIPQIQIPQIPPLSQVPAQQPGLPSLSQTNWVIFRGSNNTWIIMPGPLPPQVTNAPPVQQPSAPTQQNLWFIPMQTPAPEPPPQAPQPIIQNTTVFYPAPVLQSTSTTISSGGYGDYPQPVYAPPLYSYPPSYHHTYQRSYHPNDLLYWPPLQRDCPPRWR